ncbi:helix-turn-helix domain-containing protein [Candidatus Frankia alpina]|uniref:Helix-turn-helix transcriptional regulator n=1 Tax=Candidatus Frankia alpina TaxID=2699483 RepID=A0A4V3YZX1_9ACTN|nr:helix-turn-helix transcriptional regulator [Candidatus Frankia alpina]THJ44732.1 helix-turn-helix transcriptional regulator [Candidatus Frankia alpina]
MTKAHAEDLEATINETIKLLITRTGKRQADVAEVLGITRGPLTQRLLGNSNWKINDLPVVADYFGLTFAELTSGYTAIAAAGRLPPPGSRARAT